MCKQQAAILIDKNVSWSTLSIVEFSSAEKNFILVGDDEIRSNGNMYDILQVKVVNGITIYYSIADGTEDKLMEEIAAFAKTNSATGNTSSKKDAFELTKFVNDATDYSVINSDKNNLREIFSVNRFSYSSPVLSVLLPPPKFI